MYENSETPFKLTLLLSSRTCYVLPKFNFLKVKNHRSPKHEAVLVCSFNRRFQDLSNSRFLFVRVCFVAR